MELIINVNDFRKMTYKDFINYVKINYNLLYTGSEGIKGLFEYHKFKVKNKKEYYELNTDNITELGTLGKTILKLWE